MEIGAKVPGYLQHSRLVDACTSYHVREIWRFKYQGLLRAPLLEHFGDGGLDPAYHVVLAVCVCVCS